MEAAHAGTRRELPVKKSKPLLVHPADETAGNAGGFYYLSHLDHQAVGILVKTVHFFRADESRRSATAAVGVLKDALAKLLTHFYPYTGSPAVGPDGNLVVSCNGAGVPFVEAVADCDMDAVGDIFAADPAVLGSLVHTDPREKGLLEMPLITVQVTSFKCGGFVLGTVTNHCMADGRAAGAFVRAWAETARGLPLSTPPFIDRSVLRPRRPPKVEFPHHEFADVEDVSGMTDLYQREAMSYRFFVFGATALADLKRAVQEEDAAAAGCSSFSVLAALVWRARCCALGMVPAQEAKLLVAVDVRERLEPPLPPRYFGNGVLYADCACEAGELAARPLSFAAGMVRDTVRGVTDRYVRSAVDYLEITKAKLSLDWKLVISTWMRLDLETVDFGWGKAAQMSVVEMPVKESALLMPHRDEKGGTVLFLGLPTSAMDTFQKLLKVQCGDVKVLSA